MSYKRVNSFQIFFFIVTAAHLLAIAADLSLVQFFTKPLLVLCLLGHYVSKTEIKSFAFITALSFCCLGDSLLLFQSSDELFFMLGLGAFLAGHVFYIISFGRHTLAQPSVLPVGTQRMRMAFPVLLAGSGLVVVLFPTLGALKIPVLIYALVLTFMVVSSIFRMGRTSSKSFWLVSSGAVLFMASDALLAINKFLHPIPNSSLLIMSTYCAAQYLIVEGILRHPMEDMISGDSLNDRIL